MWLDLDHSSAHSSIVTREPSANNSRPYTFFDGNTARTAMQ
jgi:hypothetical protein